MTLPNWQYLHTKPSTCGNIKTKNSDFKVFENLGYDADGEGEHLFIEIVKDGLNSAYVAKLIARWANVPTRDVSYAGKKDRHAVTKQHFSVQLPGKEAPDIALLETAQLRVLSTKRNSKKLRTGALKGNRFELKIRGLVLDKPLDRRLENIKKFGVPNYFGQQRFGFNGENIDRARELFTGTKVKNRDLRGIYLSAARSLLFNNVVSQRINEQLHDLPMTGDAFMLSGSKASFANDILTDEILQRYADKDIQLSAPMWGKGKNSVTGDALAFEQKIIDNDTDIANGLIAFGLKSERRAMFVYPMDMTWEAVDEGLSIAFSLPPGSYATSILRELTLVTDASMNQVQEAI